MAAEVLNSPLKTKQEQPLNQVFAGYRPQPSDQPYMLWAKHHTW